LDDSGTTIVDGVAVSVGLQTGQLTPGVHAGNFGVPHAALQSGSDVPPEETVAHALLTQLYSVPPP
jgi:hypothetical protein